MTKLVIHDEITALPNCTVVYGEYYGIPFIMSYYIDYSYKINGEFTHDEKQDIYEMYVDQL